MDKRVFVEKKPGFQLEAAGMLKDLNENLNLHLSGLRVVLIYDVFNIAEEDLEKAQKTVFTEAMVDDLVEPDLKGKCILAIETLPGQYDQRADSAMQCVRLLNPKSECVITTGKVIIFNEQLSAEDLTRVEHYVVNPIETRIKNMDVMEIDQNVEVTPLEVFEGFNDMDEDDIHQFVADKGLAMSDEDLKMVQDYFKDEEKRIPTETEVRVLDTYWSDHCRHTTFETELTRIEFTTELFNEQIQDAFDRYLEMRAATGRTEKPITLMDMATINSRYLRSLGKCDDVEVSDEINACSVFVPVDHDGETETWLLQFKNETHNHPTEIEPFGGASTCIGGAIRDPLSGRSYVYQAMRITGSGDVFTPLAKTIPGKLPQRIISKKSAHGNSSYGNQIGLPTTYVRELYDEGYVAKHMEVGAVVGAVKAENVKRLKPEKGDVIILLGGKTGRDGIGGATGSSKEHTTTSLEKCASEVQKGNAPEERKIQRLFRNPECTALIKKCNDFGAGGVSVAIGELADGLDIDLDKVRTKYAGLNATEVAISESQERMAVVVAKADEQKFMELAAAENLEAYVVATVTDTNRLVMTFNGQKVVDISRDFINTSGARQKAVADIATLKGDSPFVSKPLTHENILNTLKDVNVACQKGLGEMFDASIGSTTVLMPYGGKTQLTPTQASVQKLPLMDGKTTTCSILAYGFIPAIMKYSCFVGAMDSVLISMAKTVAAGGSLEHVYFSFQEYFEKLNKVPAKWGKVSEALLGTINVLDHFDKCAIGGKDSMSGTFNDYHVPPTLISFACSTADTKKIVSPELKQTGHLLGVYLPHINEAGYPDLDSYKQIFVDVEKKTQAGLIHSAYVVEEGGILSALFKMSFGNRLSFRLDTNVDLLKLVPGAIVVESDNMFEDEHYHQLGVVNVGPYIVNGITLHEHDVLNAYTSTFDDIYPRTSVEEKKAQNVSSTTHKTFKASKTVDEVKVLVPVFPGTNCEYDTKRAFEEEGASVEVFVFRNLDEQAILDSIDELADKIKGVQILAFPGGFSSGDEPDGSAKFIVNVLQNAKIKAAIKEFRANDGLILGICNGFQALIKSGLLPYGDIRTLDDSDCTLYRNDINRHISTIVTTRVASDNSPWLCGMEVGSTHSIPVSHGEGKFVCSEEHLQTLIENGQIAFQYCGEDGNAAVNPLGNVNGSTWAIEGIVSEDGHVLGKMGHSERYCEDVFRNIPGNKKQSIFRNGVQYFKKEVQ